jgi:hypothetical protein
MQRSEALDLFPVGALAQTQTERHRRLALATGFGSQAVWKPSAMNFLTSALKNYPPLILHILDLFFYLGMFVGAALMALSYDSYEKLNVSRSGARPQPRLFTLALNRNRGRVPLERA